MNETIIVTVGREEIPATLAAYASVEEAIEMITQGKGFAVGAPGPFYIYDRNISLRHPAAIVYRGRVYSVAAGVYRSR